MQILTTSPTTAYNGIINSSLRIVSKEGFFGIWRGVSSVALGAGMISPSRTIEVDVLIFEQDLHMRFTLLLSSSQRRSWGGMMPQRANTLISLLVYTTLPTGNHKNIANNVQLPVVLQQQLPAMRL